MLLGHYDDSTTRLKRAYEGLADQQSPASTSVMISLSWALIQLADYSGSLDWGRRAGTAAEASEDPALQAAALATQTMSAALAGEVKLARELHDRAMRLIDSLSDRELESRRDVLNNLTAAEIYLDLYFDASRHGERCLYLARATGQTQLLPVLAPILGTAWWMMGEMAKSAELLDDAIESARLAENPPTLAWSLFNRAVSALMAGDTEAALELSDESVEIARGFDAGLISSYAGATKAQVLLEVGDPKAALVLLLESAGGEGLPLMAGSWRPTYFEILTRCYLAVGDIGHAQTAAARARQQADELGMSLPGLMADRAEAAVALAEGRPEDAEVLASSAIRRSEEIGARVHIATSRALAGRALAAAGQRDKALSQLETAASEFDAFGAFRYRDQVDFQLRQLGGTIHRRSRPGQTDGRGVETLTGRELEVAELVLDRRTNREIAEMLFLSTKTVESHMRNIFNKLGVSSRVEVARTLGQARV
jgi:DNA-binding NarL/FixJ family response regulator